MTLISHRFHHIRKLYFLPFLFVLFSSCEEKETGDEARGFIPNNHYIVEINSEPVTSKTEYVEGHFILRSPNKPDTLLSSPVRIKGRGEATWLNYPKKPYHIEFEEKVSLFDWNKGKDYYLLANYTDKSMIKCEVAFSLARYLNMDYTPNSEFIELFLNDEYIGLYQITEPIKQGKKRINTPENGFILEINNQMIYNSYNAEWDDFHFKDGDIYFTFKYPKTDSDKEAVQPSALQYVQAITDNSLCPSMIDLKSFAKWWYVNQIMCNGDPNIYFFLGTDNLLHAGPVWDIEWSCGHGSDDGTRRKHTTLSYPYYDKLLQNNATFKNELTKIIQDPSIIYQIYQTACDKVGSVTNNFTRWEILNQRIAIGCNPLGSWQAEVDADRDFVIEQMKYINNYILGNLQEPNTSSQ